MLDETPSGWQLCDFGEVAKIEWGDTSVTKKSYTEEGFTAYSAAGPDGFLPYFDFDCDAVVVSAIGANSGRVFWASGKWTAIKNTMVVLPLEGVLDIRFLYYKAQQQDFWHISGGAQPFIGLKNARKQNVLLPPLPEQERIAEILTSVDDSIRATEAVIAQADRVKRGLMEDLLTGGLGSEAIARGEVPEGWERKALKDVAQVITGKTPSTKVEENWGGRTPFITPSDLNHAVYIDNAERFVSDQALEKLKLLPENTLLYTCIASIGKSAIARVPCVTNQQINACVFRQTIAPLFAYYQLQLRTGEVEALAGKTAVAIINKGKFSSFEMIFPKTAEQSSISAAIGSIDEQIRASRGTIDQLQRLKRGLMDDLLTGRVRTV